MIQALALTLTAIALVAAAASAIVGALSWALGPWLDRLTARARARLLLAAAIAPAPISLGVVAVAHAPSMGFGDDHCFEHGAHHAHLCFVHTLGDLGPLPFVVAALFVARALLQTGVAGRALLRSRRASRALAGAVMDATGVAVVDDPEPHAFVLGLFRPRVFVTRALLDGVEDDDLRAVLAHERAHGRRRDPLRRLLARLAAPFHLPLVARALDRRLALAQELAADEEAATAVGDRAGIAQAILRLARRRAIPSGAVALGGADVAARVTSLLDDRRRVELGSARALWIGASALLLAAAVLAERVHHSLEHVLGVLF